MDSAQAIPLPSFNSTSSTSFAIPKLRVSRWATNSQRSTESASGSTTIPVRSRDENGLSGGELGTDDGERMPVYSLSSEGEVDAGIGAQQEEPALRLRNIMDQMRGHPFMSNGHSASREESPAARPPSPLPSVRDSDLESISTSVLAGHSAKDRLRDTWSQAMIPPVGNTPQKLRSKVLARRKSLEGMRGPSSVRGDRRESLSDENVSGK
jgi:hypothetical protein